MKDDEYLAKLQDYFAQNRCFPAFVEIGKLVGLSSTSSVAALVKRFKARGLLESGPTGRVMPGPKFFCREILGSVRAGAPHPEAETLLGSVDVGALLIPTPSRSVLLRIKGDSMQDAGLLEGDTVVVEKGASAKAGDIVVAIVDDAFTVKTLAWDKKAQAFYLEPANRAYAPIRPRTQLEVFGRVVGAFRRYSGSVATPRLWA